MASLVIGFVAAIMAFHTERFLRSRLACVDDTLACFTGHGVGGMIGIFATGVCASTAQGSPSNGAIYGNPNLLGWQIAGILVTILVAVAGTSVAWGVTAGAFHLLKLPVLLSPEHARDPDASLHGERAYSSGGGSLSGGAAGLTERAVLAIVRREILAAAQQAEGGRKPSPLAQAQSIKLRVPEEPSSPNEGIWAK
jgi:hypothetical protein